MAAWVERHFSKHAIRCAKNFESCPLVLTAITGQPKPKLPTSPSKLLCRGNILHLCVFGTMGSVGASKNCVNNEIATRSPRYERHGRILLRSPKYQQHGETVTGSRMYGERLQRRVVFCTDQQSSQAMSRRIHGLEARVSKMEGKLCALCLELKQVQQILITYTNKFSPYMPNVSHHVEVEARSIKVWRTH